MTQSDNTREDLRNGLRCSNQAHAHRVESFTMDLFAGFDAMRALTYTSSIPMVMRLLRDYDYDDFECIFGHGDVLSRDAADLLAFQSAVQARLNQGFVGARGIPPKIGALIKV